MKCRCHSRSAVRRWSLPTRGAWIEIRYLSSLYFTTKSLPTRGAWIEILDRLSIKVKSWSLPTRGAWIEIAHHRIDALEGSRSPRGERGLKYDEPCRLQPAPESLPTRGAWIEMHSCRCKAPPSRSLPTRGAWIEIMTVQSGNVSGSVAPHAGSVD